MKESAHRLRESLWHWLFCRWHDQHYAGHRRRAAVWGALADWLCS